jgi:hypothetical protein
MRSDLGCVREVSLLFMCLMLRYHDPNMPPLAISTCTQTVEIPVELAVLQVKLSCDDRWSSKDLLGAGNSLQKIPFSFPTHVCSLSP